MRKIGIGLIVLGIIWGLNAASMSTTILTESSTIGSGIYSTFIPSRVVHNLDLADQKRNHLIGAGICLLSGILLFGFSSMKPKEESISSYTDKKCPFCAETIKKEATVCRYCGKDQPEPTKPERKIHDLSKIYELAFDNNKCINCPICNAKLKLDAKETEEKQFECTDCKAPIKFVVTT